MGSNYEYTKLIENRLYGEQAIARRRREWWLHCLLHGFILLSTSILSIIALVSFSVLFHFPIWGPMLLFAAFAGMVLAQSLRKNHPIKETASIFSIYGIVNHLRISILFRELSKRYPSKLKYVIDGHREKQQRVLAAVVANENEKVQSRVRDHFSELEDKALFTQLYLSEYKDQKHGRFYQELSFFINDISHDPSIKKEILFKKSLLLYAGFLAVFSSIASSSIAFTIGWGLLAKIPLLLIYPVTLPIIAAGLATVVGISTALILFNTFHGAILENTPKATLTFVLKLMDRKLFYNHYKSLKAKQWKHKRALTFFFYSGQGVIILLLAAAALFLLGITALIGYCGFGASLNAMSHVTFYLVHLFSITNSHVILGLQLFTFFNAACLLVANIFFGFIGTAKALIVIGDGLSQLIRGDYRIFFHIKSRLNLYKKKPWYPLLDMVAIMLMIGISICVCLYSLLNLTLLVLPSQYSPLTKEPLPRYITIAALSGVVIELINKIPNLLGMDTPKNESFAKQAIKSSKTVTEDVYSTVWLALAKANKKYALDEKIEQHFPTVFKQLKSNIERFSYQDKDDIAIVENNRTEVEKIATKIPSF